MSIPTIPTNRIFSGIQPTGNLHLGNYLGAIRNWVSLQDDFESIYCVVDLHAITVPQDPEKLRQSTREVTACLIAAGISPERSILFNQSRVPQHAQLAWIFNCVARLGWLNRMTQFKEKAGKNRENATVGLFAYPTLMAADILAYQATHVPVGEDQKQHLELTRDIAQAFNSAYGVEFFPLPEPQIFGSATRVMSLRNGASKMSKSDESDYSRINLTDDAEMIAQKVKKAKTDPEALPSEIEGLEGRPEAQNLVGIYAALADMTPEAVLQEFGGRGFGDFKPALGDLAVAKLSPIGDKMRELLESPDQIDHILDEGAPRAEAIAAPILDAVNDLVGFLGHK
jgi:tryptophanyl-tRNA synthetase